MLITGGAGYVGSILIFKLKQLYPNMKITVLDNLKNCDNSLILRNIFSTNKVSENLEELIKKEIPPNSKISAVEDAFPYLYKYRNVYYYPIFMESADYVITRYDSNTNKFSGSFINLKNQNEADQCLYEKGKGLGFNYDEKIEVGRGLAIIKKSK